MQEASPGNNVCVVSRKFPRIFGLMVVLGKNEGEIAMGNANVGKK